MASRFATTTAEAGLRVPEAFVGFDEAGSLTIDMLPAVIDRLTSSRAGSVEIGVHPGERDDPDLARYRWGYRWGDELEALISARTREAVDRSGFSLASFAALANGT
jgi:hypothetical protein